MRETEFWFRMEKNLGSGYARAWADQVVLQGLAGRTTTEALQAGVPTQKVWRAVWAYLELPFSEH